MCKRRALYLRAILHWKVTSGPLKFHLNTILTGKGFCSSFTAEKNTSLKQRPTDNMGVIDRDMPICRDCTFSQQREEAKTIKKKDQQVTVSC